MNRSVSFSHYYANQILLILLTRCTLALLNLQSNWGISYLDHYKILNCNLIKFEIYRLFNTHHEFTAMPKSIVSVSITKANCLSDVAEMNLVAA